MIGDQSLRLIDYFLDARSKILHRLGQRDWINNSLFQALMTDSRDKNDKRAAGDLSRN
jgi:hypothetical protein